MTFGPRYILGGALGTALLFQLSLVLGPAGALLNLLTPFPAAWAQMRSGFAGGASAVGLASVAVLVLNSAGTMAGFVLQYGMIALVLPYLLRQGLSWGRAAAITTLAVSLIGLPLLGGLSALQTGQGMSETILAEVDQNIEQALETYRQQGLSEEQLGELESVVTQMARFLARAYFGLSALWVGISSLLLVYLLERFSAGAYRIAGERFSRIRLPEHLVWVLIASGFGLMAPVEPLSLAALNLLTFLLPLYFLQGLAVVSAWFQRRRVSPVFRALGYAMIFILNPMPLVVTCVGVFDLWVDFRKLNKK